MIHHSCDRCKRVIDSQTEVRYVVGMEIRAAMDVADPSDEHDDRDHLLEVHESLESIEDFREEEIAEDIYQQLKFDLCPECYRRFIQQPVGRDALVEFNFSQN